VRNRKGEEDRKDFTPSVGSRRLSQIAVDESRPYEVACGRVRRNGFG